MKRKLKRIASAAMAAVMLASSVSFVYADEPSGASYFDFEYSNYDVNENDGELKVKIKRYGSSATSADVAFKAADFLSTYGEDYEILDDEGNTLEKVSGVKPDPSEFVYDESTSGSGLYVMPDDTASSGALSVNSEKGEDVDPNEPLDTKEFGGSSLLSAQAQYLDLPKAKDEEEVTPSDIQRSVTEMYKYFGEAEGAEGVIHFKAGENEKEITIVVKDNDAPESDKVLMLAILGAEGENVEMKANATTYVSIIDDEEHETTSVSVDTKAITLTKDKPTAEVTIRRTSGLQYFTSVYVSTVDIDDCRGSYEEIYGKTVAFVPGENEKTVTVKATDFSRNTRFGVKLEGGDDVKIGNSLVTVNISDKTEEIKPADIQAEESVSLLSADEAAADDGSVELMASGTYLGNYSTPVYNYYFWNHDKRNDGMWDQEWRGRSGYSYSYNSLKIYQQGEDNFENYHTRDSLDMMGVYKVAADMYKQNGNGYGRLETDTDWTWAGSIDGRDTYSQSWYREELTLSHNIRNLYIKIGVVNHSNDNESTIYAKNLDRVWTRYTFERRNADQKVQRQLYDCTTGTVSQTYFDGETKKTVTLNGLDIKTTWGSDVAGYYANTGSQVVFTAPESVKKYGYILDKVYFYNNAGNKVVTKTADGNGELKITPNQAFTAELYNAGVLPSMNGQTGTIYVKPSYKIKYEWIGFYKYSNFVNLDKTFSGLDKYYNGDYVCYYVPQQSVIRSQYVPASNQVPEGTWIYRYYTDKKWTGPYNYNAGAQIYSTLPNQQKETVDITDFTKLEMVLTEYTCLYPAVDAQNLYLGYAPQLRSSMKSNLGTLEGLVIDADDTSAAPRRTDANGSMTIPNVSMGNTYSFRAFAPSGYYAKWADMTGDTNDDGYSFGTGDEPKTPRNWDTTGRLNNARTLIGDRIHINLERDNTRYQYYFAKSVLDTPIKVKGKLQRRKASILQLSTTRRESEIKDLSPVSGVFVNIAGSAAMTKEDGSYVVELSANEPWGAVSAAYTVDGIEYVSEANIQQPNDFVVPALPVFEVVLNSVKANYENSKYGIANGSSIITTYDSPLTIEMTIQGTSTVKPKDAKFSIYDMDGNYLRDADSSLFTVSKQEFNTTNSTKFTVRFNPKAAVNNGEELYVQFTDSNGKQYSALSTGYKFASELTLDKIVFPAIGSSTLENAANSDITEDIIGNPLGNFLIGQLPGVDLDTATNDYLSPGAEKWMNANPGAPLDSQYQWTATTFNWGFKKSFGGDWKYDSKKKDKDKDKDGENKGEEDGKNKTEEKSGDKKNEEYDGFEIIEKAEEDGEKVSKDKGSGYSTKSSFNWSLTPFVSFRLSLTQRPVKENGKTSFKPYFEDLTFVVGLNFDVSTNNTISTPIGIDVIINARLNGTVSAVYHMYSDYQEDWEIEGATPYTSSDFGIFKKFGPDNAVRREAYIFLDPVVSVEIGISVKIAELKGKAKFTFDMDFQFTDEEDEVGDMVINYYGDMKIDLGWSVEVFGITVYEKTYDNVKTVELFKQGTNKHINFDTADDMIKTLSAEEMSLGGDEPIGNDPVSRAYLKNRGEWNTGGEIQLLSSDTTTEKVLQQGSAGSNNVKMIKINDKEMLMLFIDDVPARNNINKRALYYTVGDGTNWSQPKIVNDDGTPDDYATLTDLGDGRIFVAWSSAEKAFDEGTKLEDMLKTLNIQAAFFDKSTKTFGDAVTLTKTTTEDYTADIYPNAVYDKATDRLMLYYTKTEYDGLDTVDSISKAESVNAYLTYENGKWSNDPSSYTDEELSSNRMKQVAASKGMTLDEYKQYYRDNWYGQRFLDLRLSDSAALTRVAESSAIYYDGQAIFAWTTDWDNDLNTTFDRDVFIQVYDFASKEFKHIIRITDSMEEAETGDFDSDIAKYSTGDYFNPVLGRSANSTYLFFGSIGEEDETGKINYVNLNDVVSTDELTKITDGGVNYYVPNQNVISAAMDSKNVMDFDVSVDSNGKIYLFYNDSVNGALQIMTAMLDDSGNAADDKNSHWTEAIQLTDVPENIYYMGLGAAIIDDMIYIGAGKANYKDEADKSLVLLKHVPTSDVVIDDISVEKKNFKAGEIIEVSALMRNKDILPETKPVNVVFTVNGNKVDTKTVEYTVPGGFSSNVNAQIEIPENPVDITFAAYVEGNGETKKITVENGANLVVDEQQLEYVDSGSYIFKSTITNVGGKPSDAVSISAVYGNTEVETLDVPALMSGETRVIEMTIEIDAEEFGKERDTTSMTVGTVYNDETIAEKTVNVNNPYYWDVVDTIAKVTDIKFEDSYTIQKGESLDIQPVISGVDAETLKVWWDSTSDGTPVEVDGSNIIYGDVVGTVTINGHIVPFADEFDFDKDGSAEKVDWLDRLPESSIIEVSAVVNVVDDETKSTTETTTEEATESTTKNSSSSDGSGRSYGGGNASSKASAQAADKAELDGEKTTNDANGNNDIDDNNGSGATSQVFNDIAGHWAQSIIEQAARDGIVKGYEDGSFKPNNSITRAEFVAMLYNSALADTSDNNAEVNFADVTGNEWYSKYLVWAVGNGIITGYEDNTFRGNNVITRQEMAVVVSKFAALTGKELENYADVIFTDEADIAPWAKPYVDDISKKAIVKGDNYGKFNPKKELTRAETAVIITNIKAN